MNSGKAVLVVFAVSLGLSACDNRPVSNADKQPATVVPEAHTAPHAVARIAFHDDSDLLQLPNHEGDRIIYRGQTWSLTWGDANGNSWPDLYLNHHTLRGSARLNVPASHLVLDPGRDRENADTVELPWSDQHSAIFIDINHDGYEDILEASGGMGGKPSALNDPNTRNRLWMGGGAHAFTQERAEQFGVDHMGARGREVIPLNLGNSLALLFAHAPREDGLLPSVVSTRNADGAFTASDQVFLESACQTPGQGCTGDASRSANLQGCTMAAIAHMDGDELPDAILLCGRQVKIFTGMSAGTAFRLQSIQSHRRLFLDAVPVDLDNNGQFEVFITGPRGGFHVMAHDATNGEWQLSPLTSRGRLGAVGAVAGDFDNDGDTDVVTFDKTKKGAKSRFQLSVWDNQGDGRLERQIHKGSKVSPAPRNLAVADYNLDGALDLVFADGKGKPEDTRENGGYVLMSGVPRNNYLLIDLVDPWGMRGLGARVEVRTAGQTLYRGQYGGAHHASGDHKRLHFGLSGATVADVNVYWAGGKVSRLQNVSANQLISVTYEDKPLGE